MIFKEFGVRFDPDMIIIASYLGNDLNNAYYARNKLEDNSIIVKTLSFLRIRSRAVDWTYVKIQKIKNRPTENAIPTSYRFYLSGNKYYNDIAGNVFEKMYLNIKNVTDSKDIKLVIFGFPYQAEIYPSAWNKILEAYPAMRNYELDFDKPDRILHEITVNNNITYKSLVRGFRNFVNSSNVMVYQEDGFHWNEEGNRIAAELIYKDLINRLGEFS